MGLFRRSPSPAVPAQFEQQQQQQHQQQTRHETVNAHLGVEQRQYYSNPNSGTPSPNLSLENTRSRSPLPTNTNASSSNSNASPWTGYLKEGQHASADNTKKARSKTNKTELKKAQSPQQATEQFADVPSVMPTVELKKLNLGDSGSRASNLDLARFSINGMLNLVDQRVNMEERQQGRQHQKPTGLGLSVGSSSGQSSLGRGRHTPMVSQIQHAFSDIRLLIPGLCHFLSQRYFQPRCPSERCTLSGRKKRRYPVLSQCLLPIRHNHDIALLHLLLMQLAFEMK